MVFNSGAELQAYINKGMSVAIQKSQEQIYQIIDRFVKEYYSEYSPVLYERTYQLFRSLVKSEIIKTSDGYETSIYFDLNTLDYHMKRLNGNEVPNRNWSEEATLVSAMHGSHGGKAAGTAIWDESIRILDKEVYNTLKKMLIDSGIKLA